MPSAAAPGLRGPAAPPTRGLARARRRSPQGDDTLPAVAESRPAALPPAQRTVGQLIAESIRLYGARFWTVLPLGVPFVVVDIVGIGHGVNVQTLLLWAFAPLFCAAYVRASQLVTGGAPSLSALVVALIVFLPFPILLRIYILPGIAWFGAFGLAVPAAVGGASASGPL